MISRKAELERALPFIFSRDKNKAYYERNNNFVLNKRRVKNESIRSY